MLFPPRLIVPAPPPHTKLRRWPAGQRIPTHRAAPSRERVYPTSRPSSKVTPRGTRKTARAVALGGYETPRCVPFQGLRSCFSWRWRGRSAARRRTSHSRTTRHTCVATRSSRQPSGRRSATTRTSTLRWPVGIALDVHCGGARRPVTRWRPDPERPLPGTPSDGIFCANGLTQPDGKSTSLIRGTARIQPLAHPRCRWQVAVAWQSWTLLWYFVFLCTARTYRVCSLCHCTGVFRAGSTATRWTYTQRRAPRTARHAHRTHAVSSFWLPAHEWTGPLPRRTTQYHESPRPRLLSMRTSVISRVRLLLHSLIFALVA